MTDPARLSRQTGGAERKRRGGSTELPTLASVLEAVAAPLNVGVPLAVVALGNVIGCVDVIDAVDDRTDGTSTGGGGEAAKAYLLADCDHDAGSRSRVS